MSCDSESGAVELRRRHGFARVMAAALLAVFLPISVLSGPMRYCLGENGHREIEFFHSDSASHTDVALTALWAGKYVAPIAKHVDGHCRDRLLLTKAVTHSSGISSRPKLPCYHLAGHRIDWALQAPSQSRDERPTRYSKRATIDPQLDALRTVVLLN